MVSDTKNIIIYPNPSKNIFNLRFNTKSFQPLDLSIMDANGKLVYLGKLQPYQTFSFGGELAEGIYFVVVKQGNKTETIKVVKAK